MKNITFSVGVLIIDVVTCFFHTHFHKSKIRVTHINKLPSDKEMSQQNLSSSFNIRRRRYSEASGPSSTDTSQSPEEREEQDGEEDKLDHLLHYSLGWRILLYLPFDPIWESFVMIVIIMDLFFLSLLLTQFRDLSAAEKHFRGKFVSI